MPISALALALGAALLHAFWNLVLARAPDIEAATAVLDCRLFLKRDISDDAQHLVRFAI